MTPLLEKFICQKELSRQLCNADNKICLSLYFVREGPFKM